MAEITLDYRPSVENLVDVADVAMGDCESRAGLHCTHSWYELSFGEAEDYSLCFVVIDGAGVEFPVLRVDVLRSMRGGFRVAFAPYDCRGSGLSTQCLASDVEKAIVATLRAMGGAR